MVTSKKQQLATLLQQQQQALAQQDLAERVSVCGGSLDAQGNILLPYFGQTAIITIPDQKCKLAQGRLDTYEKLLILTYLNQYAEPDQQTEMVAVDEVEQEQVKARTADKLIRAFAGAPDLLIQAGEALGGSSEMMRGCSVTVPCLPKISLLLVLQEGDYEIPPAAEIMVSGSARDCFSSAMISWLAGVAVTRVIRAARKLYKEEY